MVWIRLKDFFPAPLQWTGTHLPLNQLLKAPSNLASSPAVLALLVTYQPSCRTGCTRTYQSQCLPLAHQLCRQQWHNKNKHHPSCPCALQTPYMHPAFPSCLDLSSLFSLAGFNSQRAPDNGSEYRFSHYWQGPPSHSTRGFLTILTTVSLYLSPSFLKHLSRCAASSRAASGKSCIGLVPSETQKACWRWDSCHPQGFAWFFLRSHKECSRGASRQEQSHFLQTQKETGHLCGRDWPRASNDLTSVCWVCLPLRWRKSNMDEEKKIRIWGGRSHALSSNRVWVMNVGLESWVKQNVQPGTSGGI